MTKQLTLSGPSGETRTVTLPERAARELMDTQKAMAENRRILNADELASLTDMHMRMEKAFPRFHVYLFSIDGRLNGERITGCLFAGQCVMVFGKTFKEAHALANDGVHSTIALLHQQYAESQRSMLEEATVEAKLIPGPGLKPEHKAMMEAVLADHMKSKK
jgi:hypothetical protein